MNTLTRKRHNSDRGASLVEILVTVFLVAVVGTIIAGTVIAAMKSTRSTQSGVEGQSELNDALARIARDVAVADPLLATTTSWGTGVGASPSATELWTQSVVQYKCVRTRYWLDTSGTTKALKSATQTFSGETCPDPTTAVSSPAPVVKTVIKDFKDTNTSGAVVPLFTYFDKANNPIAAPIARVNVNKIARVKIDVGSNVRERANGVRLSTSTSLRALDGSLVTGVPAPVCATYRSTDNTATVIGADLTGGHDAAYVTSPVLTWKVADYGDQYVLRRANTDNLGVAIPGSWTTVGTYTPASGQTNWSITDTGMRGRHSRDLKYELDITGPGGSVTCGVDLPRIANKPPAAPVITVTVAPDTRTGPWTGADYTWSTAVVDWASVAEVEEYSLWRRPIERDTAPYNATTPNWTWHTTINEPTTNFNAGMFFNDGYEWMLIATDTDWVAPNGTVGTNSPYSNTGKTLAHNNAPGIRAHRTGWVDRNTIAANETGPVTDGVNRISWDAPGDTTIDGYRVWKRPTGTTGAYTPASANLAPTARTFDDTGVPLGSSYDYIVTAFNNGPRGTGANAGTITYYGRNSGARTIVQYPDYPAVTARGTEANPDGTNSVAWNAVPSASAYEIWEYNSVAAAAIEPTNTWVFYGVGNTTSHSDTGNARATRNYYTVIARNSVGYSRNHNVPGGGAQRAAQAAVAYQRPDTPSMTWNTAPSLDANASIGNATVFNYTRNADAGEGGGDNFCADQTLCAYHAYRDSTLHETEQGNTGDSIIGAMGQAAWWGTSATWHVYSCNPGGCSDPHSVAANHYPGPQWVNANSINRYMRTWKWNRFINGGARVDEFGGANMDGGADYDWGYSQGATTYLAQKREWVDDPLDMGWDSWQGEASRSAGRNWAMPGSAVYYQVVAYAPNGLTRPTAIVFNTPPSPTKFMETVRFCNTNNTGAWRIGARVVPQTATAVPWDHGFVNTYASHFHITQYVARRNPADGNHGQEFISKVIEREYDSVTGAVNGTPAPSGSNFPSSFSSNTGDYQYWHHVGMNPAGGNAYEFGIMTGGAWNLPRGQSGVGGAIRVNPSVSTGAYGHDTGNGRTDGHPINLTEFTPDGSMGCSGSTWHPEINTISRQATVNSGSATTPLSGWGATWGLSGN